MERHFNVRDLKFQVIEVDNPRVSRMVVTLLNLLIGEDMYRHVAHKYEKRWKFEFWATPEEMSIIDTLIRKEIETDWDEEYESLLSGE